MIALGNGSKNDSNTSLSTLVNPPSSHAPVFDSSDPNSPLFSLYYQVPVRSLAESMAILRARSPTSTATAQALAAKAEQKRLHSMEKLANKEAVRAAKVQAKLVKELAKRDKTASKLSSWSVGEVRSRF